MWEVGAGVDLEQYVEEKFRDLNRLIDQRFKDLEEKMLRAESIRDSNVATAAAVIDQRLAAMNEFRNQLAQERSEYVRDDTFQQRHGDLERRIRQLEQSNASVGSQQGLATSMDGRLRALETVLANYAGRFWAVGIVASMVGGGAAIVLHFWK